MRSTAREPFLQVNTSRGDPITTRYGQIVPVRSAGGQRLYSRDEVSRLRFVMDQLDQGLQPADAHRLLAEQDRVRGVAGQVGAAPLTVLLAERDPFAADFAEYFLRTEGYGARVVLDAEVARQVIDSDPPDLVVVDLLISGGAGLELCRSARDRSSVPIVAVSALDSRDDALRAGADAFLKKPLDPLQFVSTVRDLLGTGAFLRRSFLTR